MIIAIAIAAISIVLALAIFIALALVIFMAVTLTITIFITITTIFPNPNMLPTNSDATKMSLVMLIASRAVPSTPDLRPRLVVAVGGGLAFRRSEICKLLTDFLFYQEHLPRYL
ncbi:hypothetical protein L1887_30484 [Cichorium endivia]|nr:hypothetical protein L1887_30484 [Cichorium endivia]